MKLVQFNTSPTNSQLRQFGIGALIALPGLGWVWGAPQSMMLPLLGCGILLASVGILKSSLLKPVFIGLSLITVPIGMVVSEVVLLAMFLGVFVPMGCVFWVMRRDTLRLRFSSTGTYWSAKHQATGPGSYYHQW
jgi:hypothetical protein